MTLRPRRRPNTVPCPARYGDRGGSRTRTRRNSRLPRNRSTRLLDSCPTAIIRQRRQHRPARTRRHERWRNSTYWRRRVRSGETPNRRMASATSLFKCDADVGGRTRRAREASIVTMLSGTCGSRYASIVARDAKPHSRAQFQFANLIGKGGRAERCLYRACIQDSGRRHSKLAACRALEWVRSETLSLHDMLSAGLPGLSRLPGEGVSGFARLEESILAGYG